MLTNQELINAITPTEFSSNSNGIIKPVDSASTIGVTRISSACAVILTSKITIPNTSDGANQIKSFEWKLIDSDNNEIKHRVESWVDTYGSISLTDTCFYNITEAMLSGTGYVDILLTTYAPELPSGSSGIAFSIEQKVSKIYSKE